MPADRPEVPGMGERVTNFVSQWAHFFLRGVRGLMPLALGARLRWIGVRFMQAFRPDHMGGPLVMTRQGHRDVVELILAIEASPYEPSR